MNIFRGPSLNVLNNNDSNGNNDSSSEQSGNNNNGKLFDYDSKFLAG